MDKPLASARSPLLLAHGLLLLSAVCGCGPGVHFVRQTPEGGVVALPANSNHWPTYYRNQAVELMRQKCPNGYKIDGEELVWNDDSKDRPGPRPYESYFGYTGGSDELSAYPRREYQIRFHAAPGAGFPGTKAPVKGGKPDGKPPSATPPKSEGKDELPPPRPLTEQQSRDR